MFDVLGMSVKAEFKPNTEITWMHPGRTADICINGENAGYIGELHPLVGDNYSIETRVYIAVVDFDSLVKNASLVTEYKPLPKYPAITRDISMVIKDTVFVKDIEKVISENGGKLIESIKLFDVYQGSQIEKGFKSVSYSITFRAADRTLVDDDVNPAMKKILSALEKEFGANLRE